MLSTALRRRCMSSSVRANPDRCAERSGATEYSSDAQRYSDVAAANWARTSSIDGGGVTQRATINAETSDANNTAAVDAAHKAKRRFGGGRAWLPGALRRARIEDGRSSGRGLSIGAITGRSDAGTPERSGTLCRAAIKVGAELPMSSFLPKPMAAAARTRPRL